MVKLRLRSERQLRSRSEMAKCKRKKSVRLMMQSYKTELGKKAKESYVWPRTVEVAQDPFRDASGKNKMYYVIACNLFPESKIIQPSDTESDSDQDSSSEVDDGDFGRSDRSQRLRKLTRRSYRSQQNDYRIGYGRAADSDLSWRSQYNNHHRIQKRRIRPIGARSKVDQHVILEVINAVVQRTHSMSDGHQEPHLSPSPTVEMIHYPSASSLDGGIIIE